jgi:hypothetical protein
MPVDKNTIEKYPIGHGLDYFRQQYNDFVETRSNPSSGDIAKLAFSDPGIFL